jgi:glycosyltransferase involved in cell wall biosynthesis
MRVGFLGRFVAAKGIHRLVKLWPSIKLGPAELHFFGTGPEGSALRDSIAAKNLQESTFIHGGWSTPDELTQILSGIDLLVLPSETEGLPVVLLEAMAHGVPFVATDVGAIRTLAENNPDVTVVPLDDNALIAAIEKMADGLRRGRVDALRLQNYFAEHYAFEKTAAIWLDALLRDGKPARLS